MQKDRKWAPPATHFCAALPDIAAVGCALPAVDLHVGGLSKQFSFEDRCKSVEESITRPELGVVCACCAAGDPCLSCRYAVGFHVCAKVGKTRYRKGSLYDRCLDGQRVLFNMHRRGLPTEVIEEKMNAYIQEGTLTEKEAVAVMKSILEHRAQERSLTDLQSTLETLGEDGGGANASLDNRTKITDLQNELRTREEKLKSGGPGRGSYRPMAYLF